MMSAEERKAQIYQQLNQTFHPLLLEITDDSAKHRGHTGHGGAGHFSVTIVAAAFAGHSLLSRHRLIYNALNQLMGPEIHALRINAKTPEETIHDK